MTKAKAIWVLKNTAWLGNTKQMKDVQEAVEMAVNVLDAIGQIVWERDAAIKQLEDLGYHLEKEANSK